jgi:hypothetical protein
VTLRRRPGEEVEHPGEWVATPVGHTVLQSLPDGRGEAVVAVVCLEGILPREDEGRVASGLRKIAAVDRAPAPTPLDLRVARGSTVA